MSRRTRRALRRQLEALGRTSTPVPSAERLDATEARLRAIYDAHGGSPPAAGEPHFGAAAPRRSRRRLLGSGLAAAAALGALGGIALATRAGDGGNTALRLTAAEHAYIVLADGTRIPATAGDTVPDGARVVVEAGGTATLDGVTLREGESATIDGGEVDVRPSGTTSSTASPPPDGTATTRPEPTSRTTVPTTTAPGAGDPPPTTTTAPTTTTTAPPDREVLQLRAWATVEGDVVHVRWQRYTLDDFGAYLVLARYDGQLPVPDRPGTVVLFRATDPEVHTRDVRFRPGMAIRVVALDPSQRVVATSRVLRPFAAARDAGTSAPVTTTTAGPTTSTTTSTTTGVVATTDPAR
jgi:hypothetical protein